LASASPARRQLLTAAGVKFGAIPANIDERSIRAGLERSGYDISPPAVALRLAEAKGQDVSRNHVSGLVIAADQVLALTGTIFSKPTDTADARQMLLELRGKTHQLHSAVVLAHAGEVLWASVATAELTMRSFSTAFLDAYLTEAGGHVSRSVGGYELEGLGVQLFERVTGDYFTILGLPLLPLLAELRSRGVLAA